MDDTARPIALAGKHAAKHPQEGSVGGKKDDRQNASVKRETSPPKGN